MTIKNPIARLEHEWGTETGFFFQLRQGRFERTAFERAMTALRAASWEPTHDDHRRLVALLWYVPLFMEWQRERVREVGGDAQEYSKAVAQMTGEVERVLGVP